LQLQDELNLKLGRNIGAENKAAQEPAGISVDDGGVTEIVDKMLDVYDRPGQLEGKGFYEYNEEGRRTGLWRGLWDELGDGSATGPDAESATAGHGLEAVSADGPALLDLVERMLFAEALDSPKCIDEVELRS